MNTPLMPAILRFPPQTYSGSGSAGQLLPLAAAHGERGLLIHGHSLVSSGMLDTLRRTAPAGRQVIYLEHKGGEPTLEQLDALLAAARRHGTEWVAAAGGGSVLDIAKACAGLLHAPRPVQHYHDGAEIPPSIVPFFAAPTTAGTGSEATMVSVLTNAFTGIKKSIRHPSFMPAAVVLDPELLATCPPRVMAASGMDALTQAIESYISTGATQLTRGLALPAICEIVKYLPRAVAGDQEALQPMLQASFMAGVSLSHARLGVVHGLAHPLGARYFVPHGLACAACLLPALEFNREAAREPLAEISTALGRELEDVVRDMWNQLELKNPFAGRSTPDRTAIITETLASGSTAANPRPVSHGDADRLLNAIFCA